MSAEEFISCLKDTSRNVVNVAMRFALYSRLHKACVPVTDIAKVMGVVRGTVYNGIYQHRVLYKANDQLAIDAQCEVDSHDIKVKPAMKVVNDYFIRPDGVVLLIDNITFDSNGK